MCGMVVKVGLFTAFSFHRIHDALSNLVPFAKSKKLEKQPCWSVTFIKVTG